MRLKYKTNRQPRVKCQRFIRFTASYGCNADGRSRAQVVLMKHQPLSGCPPIKPIWKREHRMIFESTDSYISTDELSMAVDAAVRLERPLLIKGEPGTGKTMLAIEVAKSLGLRLIPWHIKSTTKAINGLY